MNIAELRHANRKIELAIDEAILKLRAAKKSPDRRELLLAAQAALDQAIDQGAAAKT